jgi:hypothetical protein
MSDTLAVSPAAAAPLRRVIAVAVLAWLALNAAILMLAHGYLPFDRPNLAGAPFWFQVAMPTIAMVEQLALMGLVAFMTRGRPPGEIAVRAPAAAAARREVGFVLVGAMAAQAGGWVLGPALGFRPFSFHLAGTLVGCSTLPSPKEAMIWAGYNFVAFAVAPFLWFHRRYSLRELCLTFDRRGRDLRVTIAVLLVESAVQLAVMPAIVHLPLRVILVAAPLTFLLFLVGTVLPTMVIVYSILLPRYYKLTGSVSITVILGGLTYAAMHLVEGWSSFASPADGLLSVLFVFLSYTGPGMFKSFVTLRTSNAWVHAIGYHAFAPHTLLDTPLIAKVFGVRG